MIYVTEFAEAGPITVSPEKCRRGICEFCGSEGLIVNEYRSRKPILMAVEPVIADSTQARLFSQNGVLFTPDPGDTGFLPHYVVCSAVVGFIPPAQSTAIKLRKLEVSL